MTRRLLIIFIAVLTFITGAYGQECQPNVQLHEDRTITLGWCADSPDLEENQEITIEIAGTKLSATVVEAVATPDAGIVVTLKIPERPAGLALIPDDEVTIHVGNTPVKGELISEAVAENKFEYDWSIGPATKGDEDGDDAEDGENGGASVLQDEPSNGDDDGGENTGALRFRYAGEYARGGFFGQAKDRLLQTTATLLIDTTDQESADFIDNNRLAVGVNAVGLELGRLWMHGTAGVEARVEKGFHHSNRNADVVAKVTGFIPAARSVTLFPKDGVFIAAPLSFTASYGYRDKKLDNANSSGPVFEATALYHLFLFDKYQIDLSARWTHNDIDDLPAGTSKTQRMYKATVSYLTDLDKGFKVLTSFENGSFGVMLKEVRQYFIGVAISKFPFGGSTENP